MLEQKIKEMQDCALWRLLSDVSEIIGDGRHEQHQEETCFWLSIASALNEEIDKRLLFNSDADLNEGE